MNKSISQIITENVMPAVEFSLDEYESGEQFAQDVLALATLNDWGELEYTADDLAAYWEKMVGGIITPAAVAQEYGIKPVTVRAAIHRGQLPARKSGSTWLIRRADALARWGGKLRSILLTLVSVGLSLAIWATMA